MELRELARKCQAKAESCAASWRLAALLEHVEDPLEHLRRDAYAGVAHPHDSVDFIADQFDVDAPAFGRVARCVAKEVCHHLDQPTMVTDDLAAAVQLDVLVQQLSAFCNRRRQQFDGSLDRLPEVELF